MKVVGNLKGLIGEIAVDYIGTNSESFRSNVPGPVGADGPIGVGAHHLKGTSTTQNEGDFAYPGETDTYTFYPDANETYPLGWFNVRNGQDAYNYAVTAGYTGTEADFYLELASIREYFEQSEVNAYNTSADAVQTAADREAAAADRVIVIDAKAIVLAAKDATVMSADTVQEIFLGTKASDPIVDNQGNPLVVGVMYFNSTSGTLRIWTGTEWTLGAFGVAGAVLSVNGRTGDILLTKSDVDLGSVDNTADAVKNVLSATKLTTARTITISGDVTGSVSFNGSVNATIVATVADNSHLHTIANVTGLQSALDAKVDDTEKGSANGVATLDVNGKVTLTQIPDSVLGQLEYQGIWNFTTLPNATQKGQYWIASVSGNGYLVGDWAVWNGVTFDKVDNTDAVASVAGRTGNVVLTKADVGLDLVDNTTDASKNVLSATKLTTARNIALTGDITGNVNFDGSGNVSIATTIGANSVALGTDTTGNYVAGNTAGTGIAVTGTAGEGWSPTISLTNTGTSGTYRSVTTDAQGRIISGTNPTTVTGYGLTDVYTKTEVNSLMPTTLPASDVYAWAKAATKPTYTASEVGLGNVTNESKSTMFNNPTFTGVPVSTTAAVGTNTTQVATTAYVIAEINKVEEW